METEKINTKLESEIIINEIDDLTKPVYFKHNDVVYTITFFSKCTNEELRNFLDEREIKSNYEREKLIELCIAYINGKKIDSRYYKNNLDENSYYVFIPCLIYLILITIILILIAILILFLNKN